MIWKILLGWLLLDIAIVLSIWGYVEWANLKTRRDNHNQKRGKR